MDGLLQKAETYTYSNDYTFFTAVGSEETGYTLTFKRKEPWGDYNHQMTVGVFLDMDNDRTPKRTNHIFKTLELVEKAIRENPNGHANGKWGTFGSMDITPEKIGR